MKTTTILFSLTAAAMAVLACGEPTNGSEPTESTDDRIVTVHPPGTPGGGTGSGPGCGGWACSNASRPVSDDEIFDLIASLDGNGPTGPGTPGNPGAGGGGTTPPSPGTATPPSPPVGSRTVRLAAVECVSITNACVRSCSVRTMCGGGGHVNEQQTATLASWLAQNNVRAYGPSWAQRSGVGEVTCSRAVVPHARARCKITPEGPQPPPPPADAGSPVDPIDPPPVPVPVPADQN